VHIAAGSGGATIGYKSGAQLVIQHIQNTGWAKKESLLIFAIALSTAGHFFYNLWHI